MLREDTVGQLRDTIQQELQLLQEGKNTNTPKSRDRIRTLVYPGAAVSSLSLARRSGFHFEIRFAQPEKVRKMSVKDRVDWWARSKRLQPDALVCLIDAKGLALFCTVLNPPGKVNDQRKPNQDRDCLELFKDPTVASTYLALVEQDTASVREILRRSPHQSQSGTLSIVEFPGVLLPAFYPTLQALQKIKKSGDLPFAEFLAPSSGGHIEVRAPTYTMQPGFTFDLHPVMETHAEEVRLKPGVPFDIASLTQGSSLDAAQAKSLVDALTHRLSLIQGPPGTGKSYTGVAILKVLLARKKLQNPRKNFGPILCICYTNHALDQLLEDVLDSGVTTQIIRVGAQSKSDRLKDHNLRTVVRSVDKTREEGHNLWAMHEKMDNLEEEFLAASKKLRKAASAASVRDYLQERYDKWYLELFGDDEDGFRKVGNDKPETVFRMWLQCKIIADQNQQTNGENVSIHALPKKRRHALYHGWIHSIANRLEAELKSITSDFVEAQERYGRIRDECDLRCLRQADIIGVTTSGLARKLEVLRRTQSKIMLCEEAGEVLEPHLLAALLPSLEHTILIGDHMQLRPQVQNFELSRENHRGGAKYCLDVSLFERLVDPDPNVDCAVQLPYSTLQIQRRMHPNISQLIRETLYPALKDHGSVSEYPQVPGMRKRLFWLDHKQYEGNASDDATATSYWNGFEIDMVAAIVTHLINQGKYKSGEVAVLTPYLGQLHRLRKRLKNFFAVTIDERDELELDQAGLVEDTQPETLRAPAPAKSTLLQALRVATIDNFQGEEAKVVVISLVRSNAQRRCGFTRTSNRINVLLSRAQHGMYILGNSETVSHVQMWSDVLNILETGNNIGTELELCCPRHPDKLMNVSTPDDFTILAPEGGCNERCIQRLQCGHACTRLCHSELLHEAVRCEEPCQRSIKGCDHACPIPCGDPCPARCSVPIKDSQRTLPCGHFQLVLPCWQAQDLSLVICRTKVTKSVPGCNHNINVMCYQEVTNPIFRCPAKCCALLSCGHICQKACSKCRTHNEKKEVQVDHGQCDQACGRLLSSCAHGCITACHEGQDCPPCEAPCDVQCGHSRCPRLRE